MSDTGFDVHYFDIQRRTSASSPPCPPMAKTTWMERDAAERAKLIAEFVATLARHDMTALPVGAIAKLPGCPVRPGGEAQTLADAAESEALGYLDDRDYHLRRAADDVGSEAHCQRVTQALTVAFNRGLVARTRRGKGPWRYYVHSGPSFPEG